MATSGGPSGNQMTYIYFGGVQKNANWGVCEWHSIETVTTTTTFSSSASAHNGTSAYVIAYKVG